MLTDLNLIHNEKETLWRNINPETAAAVKKATLSAFSKKLPVLKVLALEEFGLWKRYGQFLLIPPHHIPALKDTLMVRLILADGTYKCCR